MDAETVYKQLRAISTKSDSDVRLIADMAAHAAQEGYDTMMRVCERVDAPLELETLVVALMIMHHKCDHKLKISVEYLRAHGLMK